MNGPDYGTITPMTGKPVPGPPPHIAALMAEAGRTGNQYELQRAKAEYIAWLKDHGHLDDGRRWDNR